MATINDRVYMVREHIPYEGDVSMRIYANVETAKEQALKLATEQCDEDQTYEDVTDVEAGDILAYKVYARRDKDEDKYPRMWITVEKMVIH